MYEIYISSPENNHDRRNRDLDVCNFDCKGILRNQSFYMLRKRLECGDLIVDENIDKVHFIQLKKH